MSVAARRVTQGLYPLLPLPVVCLVFLGLLSFAACSPPPSPPPDASPTLTLPATEPKIGSIPLVVTLESTAPAPSPANASRPTPTPRPTHTPTPPHNATSTKPEHLTGRFYEAALRQGFQSDGDQFPNATRYQLDLTLDLGEARLSGSQYVAYTNTETVPLDALYVRLFPNTPGYGGQMSVTHLALDGEPVEPISELQGSALRIPLDPSLAPGMHASLVLDFALALPTEDQGSSAGYRQLGIFEDVVALASAYPIIPVYDDEGWNVELAPVYGDAIFSDAAFFDVTITAPQTMTLAASGTCTPTKSGATGSTWSCVAAPMRDFNAVLGEHYQLKSRGVASVTVNSLFYSGHEEGGIAALDYATRAMGLFDSRIGPYPFVELDVVETPTLAGGVEYPGLVVLNQSYYKTGQGVSSRMEWVVVHEVLHQWWYSLVGNDQVDEPWLDEALAQYCTLLYYEEQYGQDTADRLLESVFQQPYQELQETGRDEPVGLPVADYSSRDYAPVVYQKGPLYFHNLRQQVGLEAFWQILRVYFEQNRYRIARSEDWLTAVKTVTGSEHRSLYNAWIREAGG